MKVLTKRAVCKLVDAGTTADTGAKLRCGSPVEVPLVEAEISPSGNG
jgi:hypothetical protein